MQRTKEDIYALIKKGETFHMECKKAQGGLPGSLWESYSAFCNTDGQLAFENPGCFRISREDAVCGGRSDARNHLIFNIFALVDIGERSGHGLSNLFGVWKKHAFPRPSISESYDPDRTTIELNFDARVFTQPTGAKDSNGSIKTGANLGQGTVESSEEPGQKLDNNQQQIGHELDKNWTRTGQEPDLSDCTCSVRRVYVELSKNQDFTQAGLMSKLGLSHGTVTSAIATLINRGLLRRVGPKKGGHWEIVQRKE